MLLKGQPLAPSFIGLAVAVAGAGLFALAPLAEVLLCSYLDPSVSRHLAGVALAFFGCDVAFAGFLYYLTTALPNRDKKQI